MIVSKFKDVVISTIALLVVGLALMYALNNILKLNISVLLLVGFYAGVLWEKIYQIVTREATL